MALEHRTQPLQTSPPPSSDIPQETVHVCRVRVLPSGPQGVLEPIPRPIGKKAGTTLDRPPVRHSVPVILSLHVPEGGPCPY